MRRPDQRFDPTKFWPMYRYNWLHHPTGKTGVSKGHFLARLDFLEALNDWNSQQPRAWHYWERIGD